MTFVELMIDETTIELRNQNVVKAFKREEMDITVIAEKIKVILAEAFPAAAGIVIAKQDEYQKGTDDDFFTLYTEEQHLKTLLADALNLFVVCQADIGDKSPDEAFTRELHHFGRCIEYYGLEDGKKELSRESLLTVGNGFMGVRGAFVEGRPAVSVYPGTYVAGGYNQLSGEIAGRMITNEDFVNLPNGQFLTFRIDGGRYLTPGKEMIRQVFRSLDVTTGILTTKMIVDFDGKLVKVVCQKLADMMRRHYYGISYEVTPLNFSGEIEVYSEIDGTVTNQGVERYKALPSRHLKTLQVKGQQNIAALQSVTVQSAIEILTAARLTGSAFRDDEVLFTKTADKAVQRVKFPVVKGQNYQIEKIVSVFTSLETKGNLMDKAWQEISFVPGFSELAKESREAWALLWQQADIQVKGDFMGQKLLRLHTYHLHVSVSPFNNLDLDFSIGARGLHGEAYRGHIFWDELFIFPFYALHYPEAARQLLMYRYNRLEAAKENARAEGYQGAMFPWQSGRAGDEQSQLLHLNPLTGEWGEDASRLQRHVGLAVAYNVLYYWQVTGDVDFMKEYGLEMLIEIARFWMSKAEKNPVTGRYDIDKVMGPDEFHEAYPKSQSAGLKNNTYTNIMVSWLFHELESLLASEGNEYFRSTIHKTGLAKDEEQAMAEIRKGLKLEINGEGILAQYEGYFQLKEVDWNYYQEKYGNIYRMDRLLKAEGESADEYKVAKQPDVLMAFYCLGKERVDQVLKDLGYSLPADYLSRNIDYYLSRTSHGSTLSRIIHGKLAQETGDKELAWKLYMDALSSDYVDIQGGTTAEGIHTGVMGSTLVVAIDTFGGVDITDEVLRIAPSLPEKWQEMNFSVIFKGTKYTFTINQDGIRVITDKDSVMMIGERQITVEAQQEGYIDLAKEALK